MRRALYKFTHTETHTCTNTCTHTCTHTHTCAQGRDAIVEEDMYAAMENKALEAYSELTGMPKIGDTGVCVHVCVHVCVCMCVCLEQ